MPVYPIKFSRYLATESKGKAEKYYSIGLIEKDQAVFSYRGLNTFYHSVEAKVKGEKRASLGRADKVQPVCSYRGGDAFIISPD